MAGLELSANSGNQTLSGTPGTVETILQLTAAANHRVKVKGYSLTLAGTAPVDLTVRVLRQTSAGTSGTTVTPVKLDSAWAETIQTTAATNFSAEPTAGDVLQYKRLQGSYEVIFPLGQELLIPGAGRLAIDCSSASASTVVAAEFRFEE